MAEIPREKRFCKTCGLWYGEYVACEDGDCLLETSEEAQKRIDERAALGAVLSDALQRAQED